MPPRMAHKPSEEELLARQNFEGLEMTDTDNGGIKNSSGVQVEEHTPYVGSSNHADRSALEEPMAAVPVYKVYKRRWFGLIQLILLNIVVSWDWLSYASVANTAATFYSTTPTIINWLSTAFLFAFLVATPLTLYALHKSGPRLSIIISAILILLGEFPSLPPYAMIVILTTSQGNWIRYGGTRAQTPSFGVTMFGQILIGLAQPFVLSAPTRYSDLWFSPRGRVSATAIASLANPFGGAIGQLVSPLFVNAPSDIPDMILYIAIISSVATIPSFFIPAKPPTPVSPSANHSYVPVTKQVSTLLRQPIFWLLLAPFSVYVGFFNSFSSILTQILTPYGFSETQGGIAGAVLIVVGLVAAAVTSPIVDRSKRYLLFIKAFVPIIAIGYLAFIWAPPSGSLIAPYILCAIIGAASFSLLPVALEWLVEVTWPVGPEVGSCFCWAGGQALGGIFIIISSALEDDKGTPSGNLQKALIFQAVISIATVPAALCLGVVGGKVRTRRLEVDKGSGPGGGAAGEGWRPGADV
ncbi:hypothetical protein MMC13_006629 [Lambiella insularis]|nr:hypothetical protein [Lambiella insularis]